MDQRMGHDPENAIMLENDDGEVRGRQQASLNVVEYIDLQDNKYYKSGAYGPPSIRYKDLSISTSQTRTNGEIDKTQRKAIVHDRGSTSYDQNRYQDLNTEDSHQDFPMNGMQNLAGVKPRKNTTNSPGLRDSTQQLQTTITGNGADVKLDALSRDCQRGQTISRPRLTSLPPFRRVQVHNEIAHEGPDSNADTASSHPPRRERSVQASPSKAPKIGFAALEELEKARPAPFGTLKIDTNSQREEADQLFVSDSDDQGQEGDRLCFQDPNVPDQKSCAAQQKNIGKQNSSCIKQIARQTQKSSRGNHLTDKNASRKVLGRLARDFVPTEVCGVFSESRVPAGCNPAQHIPRAWELKKRRNMTCIICGSKFVVRHYLRTHFPKCVRKNGNPNRHSWFDHPTVRKKDDGQSRKLDDEFGPFSKKTDDEPAIDPSTSLLGSQADPSRAVEHKTTGGKGISDATVASWLAQSENVDIEGEDDYNAETEVETSESAWQYHVTRQEIRTADVGLEDPIERYYTPYWTLEEANAKAGEEIQIRDVSPPPGPHPRGWNLQFRKDGNGMDSHTVEVQGTTITTTVTRTLIPRAELTKHRMPASAFITPQTVYTILSVSIHHTTLDVQIQPHGHYTLRTKANERAGDIWVEQFTDMEATGAVRKYDLEREIRKEVRELAEVEGGLFDKIVGADGEGEGAMGRVWVVEEVVRGPRN